MNKNYISAISCAALLALAPALVSVAADNINTLPDIVKGLSSGDDISALFDDDASTTASFTTDSYIYWNCPSPVALVRYSLTAGPEADKTPRAWRIEGSRDGSVWTQVDRKTAQTINTGVTREFSVNETKQLPYSHFRLIVETVKGGGSTCCLADVNLYGESVVMAEAPSDIRVKEETDGLRIAWRDNSDCESGFRIYRSYNGNNWNEIATVDPDVTSFLDSDVPAGVGVIYRVCSLTGAAESQMISTGVIQSGNPANLTCVNTNRSITVVGTNPINTAENGPKGADGNKFTKYLSTSLPAQLTISLDEPIAVTQYTVVSANDASERDPRTWTVEASDDGQIWEVIDTKKDQTFTARFQNHRYRTANTRAWRHYRINITANCGAPLTQLADFLLFADIDPRTEVSGLIAPDDLKINPRTYNQIELTWTDNNEIEDCYVIQRSTDGTDWNREYVTKPGDQRCYPYSLKPNTTYYFRIAAKAGDTLSEWSEPRSVTTPGDEWPDTWPDFNFDYGYHTGNLIRKYSNDDIAIFVNPEDVNAEGVSMADLDISWMIEPYTKMWVAIRDTYLDSYGEYLVSDPKLYIVPHYHQDGGGLGRLYHYRDHDQLFRNIVHISVGKNSGWRWEHNPGNQTCNFLYDVMTHESGHIIEGIGAGKKNSPFYPVWLDSKWAEIFQYDIFGKMDPVHQAVWHKEYMTLGTATADSPAPGSEWYAKWLYPTYRDFGGDQLFLRFFALLGEYYLQRDGELQGDGNLGEYIHFMSGAAGIDVTSYAADAFGWCDEWELQLLEARNRYPEVTYAEAAENPNLLLRSDAVVGICGGDNSTLSNINDGDRSTLFDSASKGSDTEWYELTYTSSGFSSAVSRLALLCGSNKNSRPTAIELLGSVDGTEWETIIRDESPVYDENNDYTALISEPDTFTYYKLRLRAYSSKYVSMSIGEWELEGTVYPAIPSHLAAGWSGEAVVLGWSAPYKGIDAFEIQRSCDGSEFETIAITDVTELSYLDYGVTEGKEYLYRIRDIYTDGSASPFSGNISVTTTSAIEGLGVDRADLTTLLDSFPENYVQIYDVMGNVVAAGSMSGYYYNNVLSSLQSSIYIVTAGFGDKRPAVRIKISVTE